MIMKTLFSLLILFGASWLAQGQGTAFTYQGRLTDNGSLANGSYEMAFGLFGASSGGNPLAPPVTNNVAVTNGLFVVTLDFGAAFPGAERWLEIAVRSGGGDSFTLLNPRQKITAAPYAITAQSLTGVLSNSNLAGTYSNPVALNNAAN